MNPLFDAVNRMLDTAEASALARDAKRLDEVSKQLDICECEQLIADIRRAVYADEKAELLIQLFTAWRDRETDAVMRSMHAEWISQLEGWKPQWAQDRALAEAHEEEEARADLRRIRGY